MTQTTASPADRADVADVLRALGPVAVVRMVPVTTYTAGEQRTRTHVTLYDATGADLTPRPGVEGVDAEGHAIARDTVRAAFPGRVWARDAFDYHAGTGLLTVVTALRVPPREVVPLASRTVVDPDTLDLGAPVADDTTAGGAR